MTEEVSRKAVLILVIIAVVISILSTSLVLSAVYNYIPSPIVRNEEVGVGEPGGRVTLSVPPQPVAGKVTLEVVDRNG